MILLFQYTGLAYTNHLSCILTNNKANVQVLCLKGLTITKKNELILPMD